MSNFKHFKDRFQAHFAGILQHQDRLFVADVDKETLWDTYLSSFPEDQRQEFNCHCCKSFLRQYGGLVVIINNQTETLWSIGGLDDTFATVAENLHQLVAKAPVREVFVTKFSRLGTDYNYDTTGLLSNGGQSIVWQHLFYNLPSKFITTVGRAQTLDGIRGDYRTTKEVFKRSLEELTVGAIQTVLELIAQNSLYRGAEFKDQLEKFQKIKNTYDTLPEAQKDNFCWSHMAGDGAYVARIRNTAIGTLLVNVSNDMDLDEAVGKFEAIMAPANYKRPNAIITKKMIEEAEQTIEDLGLKDSLGRRFAAPEDIRVNNVLFVNRNVKTTSDIFGQLKEGVAVNPKQFGKVEEIGVQDFVQKVLPTAKNIELLLENGHSGNLVSLIAPVHMEAPSLFKWNNGFSWSYRNALADSMKEKVKAAGGRVEGDVRVSLEWYNFDDLDLHLVEPGGYHIYYPNKRITSPLGGMLDVDMNAGHGDTRTPVENIIYPSKSTMREGTYRVYVYQFNKRETVDYGFRVELEINGEVFSFEHSAPVGQNSTVEVVTFTYSKKNGFTLNKTLDSKTVSKTMWGMETNRFQKVSMIIKSPNYWDGNSSGNEHLFFVLDGAHNDEVARGFFNEFLKADLLKQKRVFEALGSKMQVGPADKQVSGVGFSSTTKGDVVVKVEGATSRTLKIKF